MAAVIASPTALSAVVSSSTAMAASATARTAIEASTVAINALNTSPLVQTAQYAITSSWVMRRSGRVWVCQQRAVGATSGLVNSLRYTVNGNTQFDSTVASSTSFFNVNKFMTNIENMNNWSSNTAEYRFIPC